MKTIIMKEIFLSDLSIVRDVENKESPELIDSIIDKELELSIFFSEKPSEGWINNMINPQHVVGGGKYRYLCTSHTISINVGNAMEHIFRKVARFKYNTPTLIAGHGVSEDELFTHRRKARKNKVIILTRLNIPKIKYTFTARLEEKKSKEEKFKLNQEFCSSFQEEIISDCSYFTNNICAVEVDLVVFSKNYNQCKVFEIKLSADTDTGKNENMLIKNIVLPALCIKGKEIKSFLGIISNNKGIKKNGEWKGSLAIDPEMVLVEDEFWSQLSSTPYSDFQKMIKRRYAFLQEEKERYLSKKK